MFSKLFGRNKHRVASSEKAQADRCNVDLDMWYCPQCGDEYRFSSSRCAACRVDLVDGRMRLHTLLAREQATSGRLVEISPNESLITLRQGKVKELKSLQRQLTRHGIASRLSGEAANCRRG